MPPAVDPRHLMGLLGTAGKSLARAPQARDVIARVRDAGSPGELARVLSPLDLGLEPPARAVVVDALARRTDDWASMHAALVRSAEQALEERFHSGA